MSVDSIHVNVNALPSIDAGQSKSICVGMSDTLSATSSNPYIHWSTGDTTASIIVTPQATTIYTVSTMNISGCSASDNVTVTVHPLPPADAGFNAGIIAGAADTFAPA